MREVLEGLAPRVIERALADHEKGVLTASSKMLGDFRRWSNSGLPEDAQQRARSQIRRLLQEERSIIIGFSGYIPNVC